MIEPPAVLFEDAHLLAVSKPAGLLTQGIASGEPTLEQAVRRLLAAGADYLGTVHRLDRPVSGVVVWAKTPKAARRLSAQFAARETDKEYWAVVDPASPPVERTGVWDDWLARSADAAGVVRAVAPDSDAGRRAVTRFRVEIARALPGSAVWLRLWPETGRTHQLRAQAGIRGLPVWGDAAYGSAREFPEGIALHARALTFRHPVLGREITVTAPTPEVWRRQGIELPS